MFFSFAVLAGLAPYGCGGSNSATPPAGAPSASYNTYNGAPNGAAPNGYPAQGQPAGYPPQGAPNGYPAQTAAAQPTAAPQPQPTAAPTQGAQDAIVGALIAPLGAKYAPGMSAQGAPFSTQVAAGQHQSTMISMTGGQCYTIVGVSPPGVGVTSLSLNLLAPPFYTISAGSSTTNTNESVIGAKSSPVCPIVPMAVQYKVDIFAKTGQGPVAVQVYAKAK